jgi:hypothetical protein
MMSTLDAAIRFDVLPALVSEGGFTFDVESASLVGIGERRGYAIAIPDSERILGSEDVTTEDLVSAIADLIMEYADALSTGAMVGGWHSTDRNVYMVEISDVITCDRTNAIAIGRMRGQESVFDLSNGECVSCRT